MMMHRQQFTKMNVNVTKVASGFAEIFLPNFEQGAPRY